MLEVLNSLTDRHAKTAVGVGGTRAFRTDLSIDALAKTEADGTNKAEISTFTQCDIFLSL